MATKNGMNSAWTAELFVRTWQAAASGAEVAKAIGISRAYAYQVAHRLRKAGVPLRRHNARRGQLANLNVERLAEIARSLEHASTSEQ